jgi:dienelactone hydrolase
MRLTAAALAAFLGSASIARAADPVEIRQGDTVLHSILFRPEGPGPFPAVVALHDCGSLMGRSGAIVSRFADWGDRLVAAGLAVVFPDSFGSRGISNQCRVRERKVRSSRERVADAVAARHWLQEQPFTLKDRVSLLGWSNGAIASLWTVRTRATPKDGMPDFRSAVAFYPGCRRLRDLAWSARVPTLILMGRADDWTSVTTCEQMVAGARGRSARTSMVVYPGAYHQFDRPDYALRELTGLANTADGSGKAHVGTNPAARSDALKRVAEWLTR